MDEEGISHIANGVCGKSEGRVANVTRSLRAAFTLVTTTASISLKLIPTSSMFQLPRLESSPIPWEETSVHVLRKEVVLLDERTELLIEVHKVGLLALVPTDASAVSHVPEGQV